MLIRKFKQEDIQIMAEIHSRYLGEGYLSKLGEDFLRSFYKLLLAEQEAFAFVAEENGEVVGFAAGSADMKSLPFAVMIKLFPKLFFSLLQNPLRIVKFSQVLFYPSFKEKSQSGEIFSLAVKKKFQGKGVGGALINACRLRFKKLGYKSFVISVRGETNEANNFYKKVGLVRDKKVSFLGGEFVFWKGKT